MTATVQGRGAVVGALAFGGGLGALALGAWFLAGGLFGTARSEPVTVPVLSGEGRLTVLAEGLDRPWALEVLPEGQGLLLSGRGGALWHIDPASGARRAISGASDVVDEGQGGLLDIALAPDFGQSRRIWLAWSGDEGRGYATTRLGHGQLDLEAGHLTDLETVFSAAPAILSPAHFGARIVFAEDGLYLGLGDRAQKDFGPDHVSQRLDSENGSVIRLNLDGSLPADNPFAATGGASPAIWSIGHRNIQAMTRHPDTGEIWLAEHGENGGDEINLLARGGNYGWPLVAEGVDYRTGQPFSPGHSAGDGFIAPLWNSPAGREAPFPPSGMLFYQGAAFPELAGHLLVGNLGQRYIGVFDVRDQTINPSERERLHYLGSLLADQDWRIRDLALGPEGEIYVISDGENGILARLDRAQ